MRVSVAMTTYNGERFVEKQLFSPLDQTYLPDEVIIFDDCSTDKTRSIIEQFIVGNSLNNWILQTNTKNTGYILNFHNAIQACSGDIIFLCDQDDIWEKDKIQTMVNHLVQNPEIKVLNTAIRLIDERDNHINIKKKKGWVNENILKKRVDDGNTIPIDINYLIFKNISTGCSICFIKQIKDDFIKHHSENIPHDWLINILGSLRQGTFFFNHITTNYRKHNQNTIGVKTANQKKITTQKEDKINSAQKLYRRAIDLDHIFDEFNYNESKEKLTKYIIFLQNRLAFTRTLSLKDYIKMFKNFKIYISYFDKQIILSDLIYLLRADKIFR